MSRDKGHEAPLPRRTLGKTGRSVSVIGMGGIVLVGQEQTQADNLVAEAVDQGVNYFDVAPQYGDGEAETKLGPALRPYRDNAFLACKTHKREKAGAAEELRQSLRRLKTDHVDLYQMHGAKDPVADIERALGPGGAMEAFVEAREQGLVRHIGFSAHTVEAAMRAIESDAFDTILFPVNFVCHHHGRFDETPLAAAEAKGMGRLALKSMARTSWPAGTKKDTRPIRNTWYEPWTDPDMVGLALRWTLGRGVHVALPPGDAGLFRMALAVRNVDRPLDPEELARLDSVASSLAPIFPQ
jgi:aryl-alcohol dehydrogenase-like predicted oxidoreductase